MRTLVILLVIAAVVAAGWWRLGHRGPSGPQWETTAASKGKLTARVTATGTLSAVVTVQVGSQVSGRLQQIAVDYNDTVKKGQLLAKIDPQLFDAALEQAKANVLAEQGNVAKAKAQAADAERVAKRDQALLEQRIIAQADVDAAITARDSAAAQVEVANAGLAQAQASLHLAEVNLDYTTIVSPIDGLVISRSVDVGQTVAASLQAPTLFTLAEDLAKMQVDASVAESDVGKLSAGMEATFTVDAWQGERFTGTVRQIRNSPQVQQGVVTYDAVIDVQNPKLKLRPGMTANVTFVYAQRDNVLQVPNAALRFRPPPAIAAAAPKPADAKPSGDGKPAGDSGQHGGGGGGWKGRRNGPDAERTVWVLRDSKPAPMTVKTGITDGSATEIVSGDLAEGDLVITDAIGGAPSSSPSSSSAPRMPRGF
jgi:HlyD family secretion protein